MNIQPDEWTPLFVLRIGPWIGFKAMVFIVDDGLNCWVSIPFIELYIGVFHPKKYTKIFEFNNLF